MKRWRQQLPATWLQGLCEYLSPSPSPKPSPSSSPSSSPSQSGVGRGSSHTRLCSLSSPQQHWVSISISIIVWQDFDKHKLAQWLQGGVGGLGARDWLVAHPPHSCRSESGGAWRGRVMTGLVEEAKCHPRWNGGVLLSDPGVPVHLLKLKDIESVSNPGGTGWVSGRRLRVEDLLLG